jgi:hypothetical protein
MPVLGKQQSSSCKNSLGLALMVGLITADIGSTYVVWQVHVGHRVAQAKPTVRQILSMSVERRRVACAGP